jgi:hypothetical protein
MNPHDNGPLHAAINAKLAATGAAVPMSCRRRLVNSKGLCDNGRKGTPRVKEFTQWTSDEKGPSLILARGCH